MPKNSKFGYPEEEKKDKGLILGKVVDEIRKVIKGRIKEKVLIKKGDYREYKPLSNTNWDHPSKNKTELGEFKSFSNRFRNMDTIRIKDQKEYKRIMKYLDKKGWSYMDIGHGNGEWHIQFDNTRETSRIRRELEKKRFKIIDPNLGEAAERDYKAEYKKYQSSDKSKKYRAELNKYNRDKGTYGNGDGKDASHKGGKIAGFEKESVNRGRAERSRLKKEASSSTMKKVKDTMKYDALGDLEDLLDKYKVDKKYHREIAGLMDDMRDEEQGIKRRGYADSSRKQLVKVLDKAIKEEKLEEANPSVIRQKLLKKFGKDPLYKDFIVAKTPKEQKKALAVLKSIRGSNAFVLMQKYVKSLSEGKLREGLSRWKVFVKGESEPLILMGKSENDVKQIAHSMIRNSSVKIVKVVKEGKLTESKKIKYKKNDWKKYNQLVKKGKSVMALTAFGDEFAWEEGSNGGVFASESSGREIELSHDDIDMVEIY